MSKDADPATCNKCLRTVLCKGGNTSNLMKHLAMHSILLKAKQCAAFHRLRNQVPSTSAATNGASILAEESPSPANVEDTTVDKHSNLSSCSE